MEVSLQPKWLSVDFPESYACLSWAVSGAGYQTAECVLWHQIQNQDLPQNVDPDFFLKIKLQENGFSNAVAMLTSADLSHYQNVTRFREGIEAQCVATVGMSNALRIGDPPAQIGPVGTINILCVLSVPISKNAMIEALSLVVEARTAAVLEAGIPSIRTGLRATGTGTDCVVFACPSQPNQEFKNHSGKHTVIGNLIGEAVYEAVSAGLKLWRARNLKKEVLI